MTFPLFAHFNALSSRPRSLSRTALLLSLAGIHGALLAPQVLTPGEARQQAVVHSRQLTAQDQATAAARPLYSHCPKAALTINQPI